VCTLIGNDLGNGQLGGDENIDHEEEGETSADMRVKLSRVCDRVDRLLMTIHAMIRPRRCICHASAVSLPSQMECSRLSSVRCWRRRLILSGSTNSTFFAATASGRARGKIFCFVCRQTTIISDYPPRACVTYTVIGKK